MAKSKNPSGLSIGRNGGTYSFGWRNGEKYGDGLQFRYRINWGGWSGAIGLGKKSPSSYSLNLGVKRQVQFQVRGNAKGSKKWSSWVSSGEYRLAVPNNPVVTAELTSPNVTKFKSIVEQDETSTRNFQYIHWETILVKDCNTDNGAEVSWTGAESGDQWSTEHEYSIEETGWSEESYSYTRWYRSYAHGVEGNTGWFYQKHVYATPLQAENVVARYDLTSGTGVTIVVDWDSPNSIARPIDTVTVEYVATKPEVTYREIDGQIVMSLTCPTTETGWTALKDVSGVAGKRSMSFNVPVEIGDDQCLFVRVNNKHDENVTYGEKTLVTNAFGKLKLPNITELTPGQTENYYTVKVNRGTEINEAFIGIFLRTEDNPNLNALIGIIPPTLSEAGVVVPSNITSGIDFGVKAFVANYSPSSQPVPPNPTYYTVTDIPNVGKMESDTNWNGGSVPLPPVNISLLKTSDSTVQIGWEWSWAAANRAEISWADHKDAWESTNEPQTYIVNNSNSSRWNIAGLGVGTWYIRLRLLRVVGEVTTYGTYSDIHEIKLSASPDTPSLLLSDGVISKTGFVTCYWVYVSGDGTAQMQGEICEAFPEYLEIESPSGSPFDQMYYEKVEKDTMDVYVRSYDTTVDSSKTYYRATGNVSYGEPIASTATAQHITISAEEQGWDSGETHHLAARVFSASGESSNGWSSPVPVTIADAINAEIVQHSLEEKDIPVEGEPPIVRTVLSLTEFPLTCTANGSGKGAMTTYIIERASSFIMERPNGVNYEGFEGETIVKKNQIENEQVTINQEDLVGALDDGGAYRLIAIVRDTYGQSATASIEFEVHWDHQAVMPSADLSADWEKFVTYITPIKPKGWVEGDTCDIYRLSADRPELIIQNGSFDTEYVDPYPTLGIFGGHRVVYKTKNGDYITEDNIPAWTDYTVEDDPELMHKAFGIIIDFDGEQIELPYNVSVSNSWKKGFTLTKYLGGSVQGDWDPGIERSSSANTTIPVEITPDKIEAIRRLATYTGICHVRTPDGSSYSANIEVKDDREEKWTTQVSKVSLDITKVDSEHFEGLTYDEWVEESEE